MSHLSDTCILSLPISIRVMPHFKLKESGFFPCTVYLFTTEFKGKSTVFPYPPGMWQARADWLLYALCDVALGWRSTLPGWWICCCPTFQTLYWADCEWLKCSHQQMLTLPLSLFRMEEEIDLFIPLGWQRTEVNANKATTYSLTLFRSWGLMHAIYPSRTSVFSWVIF